MHGIEMVTLLAYVGFIIRLCMQYVENVQARKGQSMELGGIREARAVGHNSTSPVPNSAATIGTVAAPSPNGTSTFDGIGTLASPDPNGTSTAIGTSATLGGDATSCSATGNSNSGSAEPHGTTFSPTIQAATSAVAY
jgi:hypothetical protein